MKAKYFLTIISLYFLGAPLSALAASQAAETAVSPEEHVRQTIEQVKEIVRKEPNAQSAELDKKLKNVLLPLFDFEKMSRWSLAANWNKATAAEQQEFVRLFSALLSRTYLKKVKSEVLSSKINVIDSSIDGEKALVRTTVEADGEKTSIDYRLEAQNGSWKVYDVIVENVGLLSNYRADFAANFDKGGMADLLEKLRAKEAAANNKDS